MGSGAKITPLLQAERLLPHYIGGELEKSVLAKDELSGAYISESLRKEHANRARILGKTISLDKELRGDEEFKAEFKKTTGQELPQNINLGLAAVEDFRQLVEKAQSVRRCIRASGNPTEKILLASQLPELQAKIKEYIEYGLIFEKEYREYLKSRRQFREFKAALETWHELEHELARPAIRDISDEARLEYRIDESDMARVEKILRERKGATSKDLKKTLQAIELVYPAGSDEYNALKAALGGEKGAAPIELRTKADLKAEADKNYRKALELWNNNETVRYFWSKHEIEKMLKDIAQGKDVFEVQSVIKNLNQLAEWEQSHQRTTIGGVLVGPPGVGKTTLVRHYLELKERQYVYIDLSEDVTRYLLYGSKEIVFGNQSDYLKRLVEDIQALDESSFREFVTKNSKILQATLGLREEDAAVLLIKQLESELNKGASSASVKDLKDDLNKAKVTLAGLAREAYHQELAGEFANLIQKNGWRDGVIIAALRKNQSIIFDEFPHFKQWQTINSLMTAKPGEKWYFADGGEWITIPSDWRMYFTGNIGRRHGGYTVAEKMSSRTAGKVMALDYPPVKEELLVGMALLSDPDGNFLRSKDDLAKLFVLVHDVFPKIRALTENERNTIAISYRTLHDIAEKLILRNDPATHTTLYQATEGISFDRAVFEVLVKSYGLYEDNKIPKEIVNIASSVGLFLEDSLKSEIVPNYLDEKTFNERKEKFKEKKEDFSKIVEKLKGACDCALLMGQTVQQGSLPETRRA